MLSPALVSLFLVASFAFGPHPIPQGSLIWSNQTRGESFAGSARRLPNGDVVTFVSRPSNTRVTYVNIVCLSHATGLALWETPLAVG